MDKSTLQTTSDQHPSAAASVSQHHDGDSSATMSLTQTAAAETHSLPVSHILTSDSATKTAAGDVCNEVSDVSVKPLDKALGGTQLPLGPAQKPRFLTVQEIVSVLTATCDDVPAYVPRGTKENEYFVVDNRRNCDRRTEGVHSHFWDDCGAWQPGPTNKTFFHCQSDSKLTKVVYRDGQYCLERMREKKTVFVPLTPQPPPDSILTVRRYYAKHTSSCEYEKRVTWLEASHHCCPSRAIYEYRGIYPGVGDYQRIKPTVMDEIKERVCCNKVKTVYDACDPVDGPASRKTVENAKY